VKTLTNIEIMCRNIGKVWKAWLTY